MSSRINKIIASFNNWLMEREKKALFRSGVCPECEDNTHGFLCHVCKNVKIRPFTKEGKRIIRERYKIMTGIDLPK